MSSDRNELERRVKALVAEGKLIDAIKALREATGMGLAEAKAAVERLAAGESLPSPSSTPPTDLPLEIVELAKRGKTIEAIKRLRERTNVSLEEAKRRIDSVPLDPGVKRAGCAGIALISIGSLGAWLLT